MPIPISPNVIDTRLLGAVSRRRQLQNFPVLADVWALFAEEPANSHDLLVTPKFGWTSRLQTFPALFCSRAVTARRSCSPAMHGRTKIMAGSKDNKLPEEGRLEVDVLKMPHHGSTRDIDDDFLERVTSPHYVFSADGKHGNPDRQTFGDLLRVRAGAQMNLHLTYPVDKMDAKRREEHERERAKRGKQGKEPGPAGSDPIHSLAAVLSAPPKGVKVSIPVAGPLIRTL